MTGSLTGLSSALACLPRSDLGEPGPPGRGLRTRPGVCMSHLLASGGQSIGVSASTSVLPMKSISFRMTEIQGTLKSLLQHHSSKASILWCSAFFIVQLSLLYVTTGKTIALTIQTFVGRIMSLFFNMLSRFGHSFSSKEQASFKFMAAVTIYSDFGAQENSLSLFPLLSHLCAMK